MSDSSDNNAKYHIKFKTCQPRSNLFYTKQSIKNYLRKHIHPSIPFPSGIIYIYTLQLVQHEDFLLFFFILTLSFFCGDYSRILLNHIPWRLRLADLSTRFSTWGTINTGSTLQTSIMMWVKALSTIFFWWDNNLSCIASTSFKVLGYANVFSS